MKRLLMRWSKDTGVNLFLLFFIASFFLIVRSYAADQYSDAKNAGNNAAGAALSKFGSKDGIKANISNPATSSNTLMTTIDASKSFNAQLSCPSSNKFIDVLIQPSPTGDLTQVSVSQDLDMDNKTDYTFSVPFPVSGVCANGVISCDAGTWSNCKYYKWATDSVGKAGVQEVGITDLGGCYCINNNCGNNLALNNLSIVLKDLGGGIVGAVQSANPQYAVSDARIEGTLITYYGQKSEGCDNPGAGSGVTNPQQYYSHWDQMNADIETTAISQAADPKSYYSMLAGSHAAEQNNLQLRSCSIKQTVTTASVGAYDIVAPISGSGGDIRPCGGKCIDIVLGIEGDNYWCAGCRIYETYYDILVKRPDLIGSATLVRAKWDDWIQIWVNNQLAWNGPYGNWTSSTGYPPGACELSTSWDRIPNVDFTGYFRSYGTVRTKNRVAVAGCGEGFSIVRLNVNTTCDANLTTANNGCSVMESDPTCKLKEETVDGVYTYRDFNPTGLTPVGSCRQFNCEADAAQVCADWWEKKRVYLCEAAGYDFSDIKKRMGNVVSTTRDDTLSMYYQDLRKDPSGNWITEDVNTNLPQRDAYEDCEKACKTRKPTNNTQTSLSGNAAQTNTDTLSYDFFYRPCYRDTCPAETGEEIVKNCQCIDEFPEAASIMETLKEAGKDIICSQY